MMTTEKPQKFVTEMVSQPASKAMFNVRYAVFGEFLIKTQAIEIKRIRYEVNPKRPVVAR